MPLTPADAASLPRVLAELRALVATIEAAVDTDGDGGKRITGPEWAAIGKRLAAVLGDVILLIVL